MTPLEKAHAKDFARVIRVVRRIRGYNQKEFGKLIGKPQSFVSKCESGDAVLSMPEWAAICTQLNIKSVGLFDYIDLQEQVVRGSRSVKAPIKIDKKLTKFSNFNVRALKGYLTYAIDNFGQEKVESHLSEMCKTKADYFVAMGNPVNDLFYNNVLGYVLDELNANMSDIYSSPSFLSPRVHGDLFYFYNQSTDPLDAAKNYLTVSNLYDCNYEKMIVGQNSNSVDIQYVPTQHFKKIAKSSDGDVRRNIELNNRLFLESICKFGSINNDFKVEQLESTHELDKRCLYRVTI